MRSDEDQIKELELEVERLQNEADRYRKATEDLIQQLAWCIGYFAGVHKPHIGRALAVNVATIRRGLLQRPGLVMPTREE